MKSVKTDDSLLAGLAAAIHIESTKNHSVEGFHIHSHQGHPWNELVDSRCNFIKITNLWLSKFPLHLSPDRSVLLIECLCLCRTQLCATHSLLMRLIVTTPSKPSPLMLLLNELTTLIICNGTPHVKPHLGF